MADDTLGLGTAPATPILALPPMEAIRPELPIDPLTGEPPRALPIALAYVCLLAAAAVQATGLALAWWRAIHMTTFDTAVRLLAWSSPKPGSAASIFLSVLMMAIGVILVATPALTGYLGWVGRQAASAWAIAAVILTAATIFITPQSWAIAWGNIGWLALPLSLAGALLLWLPRSRRTLATWERFRQPAPTEPGSLRPVLYGRLEQFK